MNEPSLSVRNQILDRFSRWTAVSAARSISREAVCTGFDIIPFDDVLNPLKGPITHEAFNAWHKNQVEAFCHKQNLCVGWAAKLINVFLKTQCYVGQRGREGLIDVIHPPIDTVLVRRLRQECSEIFRPPLFRYNFTIKGIKGYLKYEGIMDSVRCLANKRGCRLIEVEQYWDYCGNIEG